MLKLTALASRKHVRTFSWTLADQILVSGTNFLTAVLVARALGIAAFGIFSLAWLVVLFAQSVQFALLILPMMNIGPRQPADEAPAYYSAAFFQQVGIAGIMAAVIGSMWLVDVVFGTGLTIAPIAGALAVCVAVIQVQDFLRRYNFTLQRSEMVFASDMVRNLGQLALLGTIVILPSLRLSIAEILLGIALCAMAGIVVFLGSMPRLNFDIAKMKVVGIRHIHFSKWLVGSALLQWMVGNFFIVVAAAVLGPVSVGGLKAAQSLIGATNLLFQTAQNVLPPWAARIFGEYGEEGLRGFVGRAMVVCGAAAGAACILLALFAPLLLKLLFGPSYSGFGMLVVGFAVGYFFMALSLPLRFGLLAMEKSRPIFTGYIFASLFTLIASYPLVVYYGAFGAVAGIAIAQAVQLGNAALQYANLAGVRLKRAATSGACEDMNLAKRKR